ncbi:hypothetical protein HD841_002449 [Sphingomonas melonis]|uniref:DUF2155 domain-containing protein n=1 Tax=Sphingomonas melonis TaxID=152682 RepID=A0A7Y9FPH3_9SPHN|nr:hypothetical protein [Sphingomonas melonis]
MTRRWLAAGVLLVVLGLAGVFGFRAWQRSQEADRAVAVQDFTPSGANPGEAIETVETTDVALPTGGTPMAQRVAVVGLLNKRNGISRDLTLKPGQAVRVDDAIVRLRACEHTAPWEQDQLTGAFVQLDVRGSDRQWRRTFSGWLFKERPALNVVQHPVYDVWTKSCTMSWPATGPETTSLSGGAPAGSRSSAKKSPAADDADATPDEPIVPSSAPASNAQ